jgi:alkaline phosphatase D
MKLLLMLVFCSTLVACQTPAPQANTPPPPVVDNTLAILQGATDHTSTVLSLMLPVNTIYTFSIFLDRTLLVTPKANEYTHANSDWKVVNIPLSGLAPGALYTLKVSRNGEIIDERFFKTLDKNKTAPKIAVISCVDDRYASVQEQRWKSVFDQKPDMLFMIGDNVYIDTSLMPTTESDIWRRHQETRQNIALYKIKTLIPVFATWDDHDYGKNNADSTFALKTFSKFAFHTFFPRTDSKNIKQGPGVAMHFQLSKHHFLFLDNRSFRSPKNSKPETHFGIEQENWLFKLLSKNKGVFWLISGDQFFGGYHKFESYEGDHPDSFKSFINELALKKKPVVFISGDRHIAELMKIPKQKLGFTTYELTSSALHSKVYPDSLKTIPNKLAVFNKDGEHNFLILTPLHASKFRMTSDAHFIGENARTLYKDHLEIQR